MYAIKHFYLFVAATKHFVTVYLIKELNIIILYTYNFLEHYAKNNKGIENYTFKFYTKLIEFEIMS